MPKKAEEERLARVSSATVAAKTGKTWGEWLKVLDRAGAAKMSHREIAEFLNKKLKVPGWWAQMLTVGYEQARGRRVVHQTASGFKGSASKTVAAPVSALYRAWADPKQRARWLGHHSLTVRKATRNKSMRITWDADQTNVDVGFFAKGPAKSQVALEHAKLKSAADVRWRQAFWKAALETLRSRLEG